MLEDPRGAIRDPSTTANRPLSEDDDPYSLIDVPLDIRDGKEVGERAMCRLFCLAKEGR